jgi:hypothetical protein
MVVVEQLVRSVIVTWAAWSSIESVSGCGKCFWPEGRWSVDVEHERADAVIESM